MSTSKSINWLVIAVIILALINLFSLGVIWLGKGEKGKEGPPKGDARNRLIEELRLSKNQVASFDSLRTEHFKVINELREEIKDAKDALVQSIKTGDAKQANELSQRIGAIQARLDMNTFQHFSALRNICTAEQKKRFDDVIGDVLRSMGPRPGPPPHERPDGPPPQDGRPQ